MGPEPPPLPLSGSFTPRKGSVNPTRWPRRAPSEQTAQPHAQMSRICLHARPFLAVSSHKSRTGCISRSAARATTGAVCSCANAHFCGYSCLPCVLHDEVFFSVPLSQAGRFWERKENIFLQKQTKQLSRGSCLTHSLTSSALPLRPCGVGVGLRPLSSAQAVEESAFNDIREWIDATNQEHDQVPVPPAPFAAPNISMAHCPTSPHLAHTSTALQWHCTCSP